MDKPLFMVLMPDGRSYEVYPAADYGNDKPTAIFAEPSGPIAIFSEPSAPEVAQVLQACSQIACAQTFAKMNRA